MSPLLTPRGAQLTFVNPELTCGNGRIVCNSNGPRRVLVTPPGHGRSAEEIDVTQATPACVKATGKYPQGRTGTTAGYAAHRANGEMACEACVAAWTAKCAERKQALSPAERERRNEQLLAAGRRARARKAAEAALADACATGDLRGTAAGYEAHISAGQRPCKPCRQSPTEPGAACARPTLKSPTGRTGTSAGYQAHRDASEEPCEPCVAAQTAKATEWRRSLSGEDLVRFRQQGAEAFKRWRERDPEAVRATKHRAIAKNRKAIHDAKNKPCTDCGVHYPYYVMEFDHLDADTKHFNVSAGVTSVSHARLLAEIAKCEVVCANCHAERTHRRKQARKGVTADAMD